MKRKVGILLCCAIIFFSLAGCQLARENVDAEMNAQLDRLTGVLVTREHLDWNLPDGKLYATPHTQTSTNDTGATIESMTYNFENVVGFAYFMPKIPATSEDNSYWATIGDEEISDGSTAINVGDDGTSLILEGTIYVLPTDVMFCYNPVYQSADGNVYAVAGQSYSVSGMSDGMTMSQTLDDTNTVTENGETKTDSTSVKITVKAMSTPEKLVVLQMDADSNILSRAQYAPGAARHAYAGAGYGLSHRGGLQPGYRGK